MFKLVTKEYLDQQKPVLCVHHEYDGETQYGRGEDVVGEVWIPLERLTARSADGITRWQLDRTAHGGGTTRPMCLGQLHGKINIEWNFVQFVEVESLTEEDYFELKLLGGSKKIND